MAQQKRTNGIDVVRISFKHKWLRREFDKCAQELICRFGKDILFVGIRQYCFEKLDERDRLKQKEEADLSFAKYNES